MDSQIHDKIVDYLMQYRSKIPKTLDLGDKFAIAENYILLRKVDELIHSIDRYSVLDSKGWIKLVEMEHHKELFTSVAKENGLVLA